MDQKKIRIRQNVFWVGGLLISFGLSGLFHFLNEWLGNPPVTAGLFPVSESVWEHMKLPFYSLLLVILLPWCPFLQKTPFTARLCGFAFAAALSMLMLWGGFYGLKNGLLVEGLAADLILLAVSLLTALLHAGFLFSRYQAGPIHRLEQDQRPPAWAVWLSGAYGVLMIILFYILSFYQPNLPLFVI